MRASKVRTNLEMLEKLSEYASESWFRGGGEVVSGEEVGGLGGAAVTTHDKYADSQVEVVDLLHKNTVLAISVHFLRV